MSKHTTYEECVFRGAIVPADMGAESAVGWRKKIVGSGELLNTIDGIVIATTDADEVQVVSLNQGDVLSYDINDLIRVSFLVKLSGDPAAIEDSQISFGLASGQNDDVDAIAAAALFRLKGSLGLLVESADGGAQNNDEIPTGLVVRPGEWMRCEIDFATGHTTVSPPGESRGSTSNVHFFAGHTGNTGTGDSMRRVANNQRFDISAYVGGLQLFAQVQKAASTDVVGLSIRKVCVVTQAN